MKLIIDISESIYKNIDSIQNGSIGSKQIINKVKNSIPLKDMTNGEVIETLFKPQITNKDDHIELAYNFDSYWWNSPYEPQDREDGDTNGHT